MDNTTFCSKQRAGILRLDGFFLCDFCILIFCPVCVSLSPCLCVHLVERNDWQAASYESQAAMHGKARARAHTNLMGLSDVDRPARMHNYFDF